jgi:hypothetical protein
MEQIALASGQPGPIYNVVKAVPGHDITASNLSVSDAPAVIVILVVLII